MVAFFTSPLNCIHRFEFRYLISRRQNWICEVERYGWMLYLVSGSSQWMHCLHLLELNFGQDDGVTLHNAIRKALGK